MLLNAFLLSFYSVMTFSEHKPCTSESGMTNVTKTIHFAFILGFILTVTDFLNSVFFQLLVLHKTSTEKASYGYITEATEKMAT